jgi:hypothetical protein
MFYVVPDFHACYDVEVRKDGMPFPRIMHSSSAIELGIMFAGNLCGSLLLPGMPKHPGSIPLHVMYRFDRPGAYEVRYLRRATALGSKSPEVTSPWTRIEIEAATSEDRTRWLADLSAHAPTDATSLLTGYLPDLLGVPDEMSLQLLAPYLHDPDNLVRGYVTYALAYWPGEEAKKAVLSFGELTPPRTSRM